VPPRSEFEPEMNVDGAAIRVAGKSTLAEQRVGEVLGPVELHFVIEQEGGVVTHGKMPLEGETWGETVQADANWDTEEPALATGLAVQVVERPIASIETFTWSVIVKLKNGPVN
jgi:hypothetical protein